MKDDCNGVDGDGGDVGLSVGGITAGFFIVAVVSILIFNTGSTCVS